MAKYNPWIHRFKAEYNLWEGLKDRCLNPNCKKYSSYGGRGIKVDPEWRISFEAFIKHIGPRPSKAYLVDRINNDGNYEPGNVKWSTRKEQQRNMRSNVRLTYRGETKTVTEWAEELGIPREVIYPRLNKLKWSVEETLSTPVLSRYDSGRSAFVKKIGQHAGK